MFNIMSMGVTYTESIDFGDGLPNFQVVAEPMSRLYLSFLSLFCHYFVQVFMREG